MFFERIIAKVKYTTNIFVIEERQALDATVLCTCFIVCAVLLFSWSAQAASFDTKFYSGTKKIVVDVFFNRNPEILFESSLLSVLPANLPFTENEISELIADKVKQSISKSSSIEVLSGPRFKASYDIANSNNNENDKLFTRFDVFYWKATDVSPRLNHDVIVVSMKIKRNLAEHTMTGEEIFRIKEKHIAPLLISVSDDSTEAMAGISEALSQFLKHHLATLNCVDDPMCNVKK